MAEQLAISITTADGRVLRYGPDEPSADGIPYGMSYSSTMPGGHDQATFSLRTRITDELPFTLLDDVRIYGPGNVTLWEGYVAQLPRQSGDDFLVNVQCVGHSARLKWDTGFREIYVDSDVTHWESPTLARLSMLNLGGFTVAGWSTAVGRDPDGDPALVMATNDINQPGSVRAVGELWYDGKGIPLHQVFYEFSSTALGGAGGLSAWETRATLSTDDVISTTILGTDHDGVDGPVAGVVTATSDSYLHALLQVWYNASYTGGPIAGGWNAFWTRLTVHGRHGLTPTATGGYWPHDVLADVIERAAPGLTTGGIEDNTSFDLRALAFRDSAVTAEEVLLEVNKYYLFEWGVWDDKEFFWRAPDPDRLCWEARLDQGAHLNLEGDEAGNAINGVIVNFTLPDGTPYVGNAPNPAFSELVDTSADNIVNRHGIERKWARVDISTPTTIESANALGAAYLRELSLPARKGQITLTGKVTHPTKGLRPVSEIRAGDWIRVTDSATPDVKRRIVQASHDTDNRTCQVDVGNDIDKVDAILQRVGVTTQLVG
jgi:hypothetical protein